MQQEFDLPTPPPYRSPPGPDDGPRRMSMIAAGIGGGLLLVVAAWSFHGSTPHDIPFIEADHTPIRSKPENPGGMQFGSQSDDGGGTSIGRLDAPAELPNVELLHQRMREGSGPKTGLRAVEPVEPRSDEHATPVMGEEDQEDAPPPPTPPKPSEAEKHAAAKKNAEVAKHEIVPGKEAAKAKEMPKSAIKPDIKPHHPGDIQVQLTAAASEDAARAEWARLKKVAPDLLAGKQPQISKVDHNGKTFYRLRTSGFTDATHASSFCEGLKEKHGACSVAGF